MPAQYGNHASAAINAITKSGSNKFHGDLFEFVRNYAFNAANYFGYNTTTGAKVRDNLKRNQFGGVIGGPIKSQQTLLLCGVSGWHYPRRRHAHVDPRSDPVDAER